MISSDKRAKLIWNCRRGMLELDLLLSAFVHTQLDQLTETQVQSFEQLLMHTDPDIYAWLMGYESPLDKELVDIVTFIQLYDRV